MHSSAKVSPLLQTSNQQKRALFLNTAWIRHLPLGQLGRGEERDHSHWTRSWCVMMLFKQGEPTTFQAVALSSVTCLTAHPFPVFHSTSCDFCLCFILLNILFTLNESTWEMSVHLSRDSLTITFKRTSQILSMILSSRTKPCAFLWASWVVFVYFPWGVAHCIPMAGILLCSFMPFQLFGNQ